MRVFKKPISVEQAIEWLSNGRTNLYALVDTNTGMCVKVGKRDTLEMMMKQRARNKFLRVLNFDDLLILAGRKHLPTDTPAEQAITDHQKANGGHGLAHVEVPPPMVLDHISEQLIESIVNERIKEALEIQKTYSTGKTLTPVAYAHLQKIRQLEQRGLALIREIEQSGKDDPTWTKTGSISFQQATMALVRSITH